MWKVIVGVGIALRTRVRLRAFAGAIGRDSGRAGRGGGKIAR